MAVWVMAVAVTPDGRRAVSGSDDRTLKVWDLEQGALLATLEGHGGWVMAVAVTPDGRRAVSGSDDRTLKVWDLEQGALLATLEGHGDGVTAVAVTPDGRRAVSGSDDRTLKVWDLEQGALLATLEGHGDWVTAVAVTPDGRRAVSGSDDRHAEGVGPGAGRAAGDPGGPWRSGHGGGGDAGRAARGLGLGRPDAQALGPGDGPRARCLYRGCASFHVARSPRTADLPSPATAPVRSTCSRSCSEAKPWQKFLPDATFF